MYEKTFRKLSIVLSALVSVFLVTGVAYAALTLSGTVLTLSSSETIDNVTDGTVQIVSGVLKHAYDSAAYWTATQADTGAVTFNSVSDGTAGFTFSDKIAVGLTGTPIDLSTTATNKAVEVYTTSSSTTAGTSVRPIYMLSTMTGVGGVGGRAEFAMATEVVLGSWANALKGYTDFGTAGSVTGLASAVNAEMKMPNKVLAAGNYAPLELELVFQNSGRTSGTPVSFVYARASQETNTAGLDDFDDTGYFMNIQGLTVAADHVLSLTSQTLRSRIGTATRYLVLSQLQDGLGLGNATTAMDLTSTAANKAVAIYTTSSSADTGVSVEPIYMKNTMTVAGAVGGRANFHMYTNVILGGWANALKGYTEFGAAGSVTGLASAVVAEMKMPGKTLAGGNYAPFEAELVFSANGLTGGTPVSFLHAQASGDATALQNYRDTGYVMSLQGLGDATTQDIFQANNNVATHALKILIGSTPYYILLSNTSD